MERVKVGIKVEERKRECMQGERANAGLARATHTDEQDGWYRRWREYFGYGFVWQSLMEADV